MNQIAFTVGPKEIHWYGVCIAVGFLLATLLMLWKKSYAKMSKDNVYDIAMTAVITGILGARICYVIHEWDTDFAGRPFVEVFRIDKGGLEFYGGFILAFICVCVYAKIKKLSILSLLDLTAPAIAIAHACGRIGCFMQGCCYGIPAPSWWPGTVRYPAGVLPPKELPYHFASRYPVQLYESALNLLLCIFLLILMRKKNKPGMIAGVYLICYAVIRFGLEFIRADNPPFFLGMTFSQNIALFIMLPLGALILLVLKFTKGSAK